MREKTRVQAWAVSGLAMLIPMVIMISGIPISGEMGIAIWSIFIIGLVLLGMALVGFLSIIRRRMAIAVTIALVIALAISLFLVGESPRMGVADSIGEAVCFLLFSFVLMACWQVLLKGHERGALTQSAYIDAAIVSLLLNIVIVNALRFEQGTYPSILQSSWLILAFAMVSAVLSLTAMYADQADLKKGKARVMPFAYAILLGFVLPFLGLLVMIMTQGFSASM